MLLRSVALGGLDPSFTLGFEGPDKSDTRSWEDPAVDVNTHRFRRWGPLGPLNVTTQVVPRPK